MTDIEFKVGDLIYHVTEAEFGIIYDFDIAIIDVEPIAKIYWQTSQTLSILYLSTLTDKVKYNFLIHYPNLI